MEGTEAVCLRKVTQDKQLCAEEGNTHTLYTAKLTTGYLKPSVNKDGMARGVPSPDYPAPLHHHLRVQGPPHARAHLLQRGHSNKIKNKWSKKCFYNTVL